MGSLLKRTLDFSDYEAAPDNGNRYEMFRGKVYVSACPTTQHQRVSRRLLLCLHNYFSETICAGAGRAG